MDAKQQDEMFWAEKLKELLAADFPAGDITPWRPDPPDVIVRSDGNVIGIEVQRLIRPTQPGTQLVQARAANCRRIVEDAKKIHISARLPSVRVSVFFSPEDIEKRDVKPLSNSLAEIVRRNIPPHGHAAEEEYEYTNRGYFSEKIHLVIVNRSFDDDTWCAPEAAWNPQCQSDYLQAAIDRKAGRYASAKEHCNEAWLLLVTNALGFLASHVDFADQAFAASYATPFDKVFLIHGFAWKLRELQRKNC